MIDDEELMEQRAKKRDCNSPVTKIVSIKEKRELMNIINVLAKNYTDEVGNINSEDFEIGIWKASENETKLTMIEEIEKIIDKWEDNECRTRDIDEGYYIKGLKDMIKQSIGGGK